MELNQLSLSLRQQEEIFEIFFTYRQSVGKLTLNTAKIIIIVIRSKLQNETNIHEGSMIRTRTTLFIHNFKTTSQTVQLKLKMVIPSLLSLKILAIEIHCSYRDTLRNKLEINSHTKIEMCKSVKVNQWGLGLLTNDKHFKISIQLIKNQRLIPTQK